MPVDVIEELGRLNIELIQAVHNGEPEIKRQDILCIIFRLQSLMKRLKPTSRTPITTISC